MRKKALATVAALIALLSSSAFAKDPIAGKAMNKTSIEIMNHLFEASRESSAVKRFTEYAEFSKVEQTGNVIHAIGRVIFDDMDCGEVSPTVKYKVHQQNESTWRTYTGKLDTSGLDGWCRDTVEKGRGE